MRLRPEKIDQIAELVYDSLAGLDEAKLEGEKSDIIFQIKQVITTDLKAEDDLEDEARALLEEHAEDIRRTGVNMTQMLRKTKDRLARERGMVL